MHPMIYSTFIALFVITECVRTAFSLPINIGAADDVALSQRMEASSDVAARSLPFSEGVLAEIERRVEWDYENVIEAREPAPCSRGSYRGE
ncbi:hypothetical protein DFP72DRAFT_887502 [Ephemerocybe angulata]|uniref:Uncharacterized protein n=1 Tax=Ephemerocybe angulata TaxID=980116 RepID=A0A8H6I466_9AGAR|nr:hypothetical protein DFP72DRAFT_888604 [Tulosesus angulatus]KAF6758545.1 hypothetical protein DFP72DRAFT_887502 [Tulosesus angulatus]